MVSHSWKSKDLYSASLVGGMPGGPGLDGLQRWLPMWKLGPSSQKRHPVPFGAVLALAEVPKEPLPAASALPCFIYF